MSLLLKALAIDVLKALAVRTQKNMYQEKKRWTNEIVKFAAEYNVSFVQAAEAVNEELRFQDNLPPEQPGTAKYPQPREDELWEDFAIMHWGVLDWYGNDKNDNEQKFAYGWLKRAQESIIGNNAQFNDPTVPAIIGQTLADLVNWLKTQTSYITKIVLERKFNSGLVQEAIGNKLIEEIEVITKNDEHWFAYRVTGL